MSQTINIDTGFYSTRKTAAMNLYLAIILLTCPFTVSTIRLQLYISSTKGEALTDLEDASRKAKVHGNRELGEVLMNLYRHYAQRFHWQIDEQSPTLDQLQFGLEPVLKYGVDNMSEIINTTLDRLASIVDSVETLDFLEQSTGVVTTELDDSISEGRTATEDAKVQLFGNILHIMGEYFKGFMRAPPQEFESSILNPRIHRLRSALRVRAITMGSDIVRDIAQQTSDFINKEADLIFEKIDDIGERIKSSTGQVWTAVLSTRQFGPLFDNTILIKNIFDKDWDTILASSNISA